MKWYRGFFSIGSMDMEVTAPYVRGMILPPDMARARQAPTAPSRSLHPLGHSSHMPRPSSVLVYMASLTASLLVPGHLKPLKFHRLAFAYSGLAPRNADLPLYGVDPVKIGQKQTNPASAPDYDAVFLGIELVRP